MRISTRPAIMAARKHARKNPARSSGSTSILALLKSYLTCNRGAMTRCMNMCDWRILGIVFDECCALLIVRYEGTLADPRCDCVNARRNVCKRRKKVTTNLHLSSVGAKENESPSQVRFYESSRCFRAKSGASERWTLFRNRMSLPVVCDLFDLTSAFKLPFDRHIIYVRPSTNLRDQRGVTVLVLRRHTHRRFTSNMTLWSFTTFFIFNITTGLPDPGVSR